MRIGTNICRVRVGWNFVLYSGGAELGQSLNVDIAMAALLWNFYIYSRRDK